MIYVNGDDSVDDSGKDVIGKISGNSGCASTSSSTSSSTIYNKHSKLQLTDSHKNVESFWPNILEDVKSIKNVDAKNQNLPLARIKKIMKLDENAKMIAAEAPLLFAKACEIFIQELTLRAWIHTEENKRRTLQRSDIATAISRYDQFDFLIDIVPREDIKPKKESEQAKSIVTATSTEQIQYYLQLSQQQQQQQSIQNPISTGTVTQNATIVNQIPVATASGTGIANVTVGPQNILLTTNPTAAAATTTVQPTLVNNIQGPQQIQILQQMVTPTGEITHIPITINANQFNLLRMHLQGNSANAAAAAAAASQQIQQVIIPTIQTHQQHPSIVQVSASGLNQNLTTTSGGTSSIFLNAASHHQPATVVSTAGTIMAAANSGSGVGSGEDLKQTINNFRGNC